MKLPTNVSESVKRRNPELYGVAPMGAQVREPSPKPALDEKPKRQPRRKRRMAVCVTLVTFRRRLLDSDNHIAGCKPARDAIAKTLGIDDGSEQVRWCYGQVQTDGEQGTIVKVELL